MPVKIARSTPRPSFGLRELLVASHISRLASRDAAKSLLSTLVSESSGECRLTYDFIHQIFWRRDGFPRCNCSNVSTPLAISAM